MGCAECGGSRACDECDGYGQSIDGVECGECSGSGVCPYCWGHVDLSTETRNREMEEVLR